MEQIIATVRGFGGALVYVPQPGDGFPEIAWGDAFFYYAPDGRMPRHAQPYGTVVTKDCPDDTASDLDPPGRRRVNVHVGRPVFLDLTGEDPRRLGLPRDHAAADSVMPHPVYGALGWISVVNPGRRTTDTVVRLLRDAHDDARRRYERRHESGSA
ncbi:DUF6194 family protein [Streptomyces sp. NBC_01754]|uniref:DUF6194 family protein n=1 Tax=Streptomyces sp. NBC_01754 TaxID=2975930 RepID=UPI002DD7E95C|nr:DUF6194 family protein [Streptomyces sp. NBC_01754]WSC96909.1 DUF6194 family protein [Streptomyces sp. NBC_01754]